MRRTAPLILGAGPAGCSAAIAIARAGASPLLLDRDEEARDQLCGGFLSWRTVTQLRALGVDPATLGAPRVERLALIAGTREAVLPLPPACFALSRRALDGALRRRAADLGARFATDTARGVEGTTVIGRERNWTGDALFLATGKHGLRGAMRSRAASDPTLGMRLRLPAADNRASLLAGRIELHLFERGYAGIVLQEDGSANLCLAVHKSLLARADGDPAGLLARLADENPHFARRLGPDWQEQRIETIGAVPYGWIARDTDPGVFRLGDQAAVIPSLAGEGIAIALASGAAAARHWLERGAEGARDYQREMAARAATAVRTGQLAWTLAENPWAARLGVGISGILPALPRLLMHLSRVHAEPALAQARAAP
jgi:flavin-dependent dehydrogenase